MLRGGRVIQGLHGLRHHRAYGGHLEVLQWVRENDATGETWNEDRVRRYACGPRQQEVLTWLGQLSAL